MTCLVERVLLMQRTCLALVVSKSSCSGEYDALFWPPAGTGQGVYPGTHKDQNTLAVPDKF